MDAEALRPALRAVFAATRLRTDEATDYALVRLPPAAYPELAARLGALPDTRFQATVREPREVSLILAVDLWAQLAPAFVGATLDAPWRLITLDISIPLDVYGYLEVITRLCAAQGASLLVASSYSTDHLLIHSEHYPAVRTALQAFLDRCRLT